VVVIPWPGVAQASPTANPPNAQATKAPATTSFQFILLMVISLSGVCAARNLAAVGSAWFAQGAAGYGRPTVGQHGPLQSGEDGGTAVPSPTPGAPSPACCPPVRWAAWRVSPVRGGGLRYQWRRQRRRRADRAPGRCRAGEGLAWR